MQTQSEMEAAAKHYWQCASEARRSNHLMTPQERAEIRDELEVTADMSDWPRLRDACLNAAASLVEVEPGARLAVS